MATSVIQSPCYYGHFFWPPGKNDHTFSCKETLIITAKFFWAHWTGDLINSHSYVYYVINCMAGLIFLPTQDY